MGEGKDGGMNTCASKLSISHTVLTPLLLKEGRKEELKE
jgi:hypothetical protein